MLPTRRLRSCQLSGSCTGRLALGLAIATGLAAPSPARAFTVATGFTEGCHEQITMAGFQSFLLDLPTRGFVPPASKEWRRVGDYVLALSDAIDGEALNDAQKFVLVSLLVGVRSPDTDGHSIANLENLRRLHGDPRPEGQYAHALRGIEDNRQAGNGPAVEGTRARIREQVKLGVEFQGRPLDEQYIRAPVYLDFYGRFDIDVWAPVYYLGRAAHALQDSFSHMLRSDADDLRKIVHVFNYVEAITSDFERERDGLPHSDSMDQCERSEELFATATMATVDLFLATREAFTGRDPEAVDLVLDRWVTLKQGCTKEDNYCDNERWLELASQHETKPYIEAIFGCAVSSGPGSPHGHAPAELLVPLLVAGLAAAARRRRRRRC